MSSLVETVRSSGAPWLAGGMRPVAVANAAARKIRAMRRATVRTATFVTRGSGRSSDHWMGDWMGCGRRTRLAPPVQEWRHLQRSCAGRRLRSDTTLDSFSAPRPALSYNRPDDTGWRTLGQWRVRRSDHPGLGRRRTWRTSLALGHWRLLEEARSRGNRSSVALTRPGAGYSIRPRERSSAIRSLKALDSIPTSSFTPLFLQDRFRLVRTPQVYRPPPSFPVLDVPLWSVLALGAVLVTTYHDLGLEHPVRVRAVLHHARGPGN